MLITDGPRQFYSARHINWAFTTPFLLLTLALLAMYFGPRRGAAVTGLLLAGVLMIVMGFFLGAPITAEPKWLWFAMSCGAGGGAMRAVAGLSGANCSGAGPARYDRRGGSPSPAVPSWT